MTTKSELKLELDFHHYSESEIIELGMKPLNNHKMNYLVYEKDEKVYFFDKIAEDLFQLFCITSRQSFYLS